MGIGALVVEGSKRAEEDKKAKEKVKVIFYNRIESFGKDSGIRYAKSFVGPHPTYREESIHFLYIPSKEKLFHSKQSVLESYVLTDNEIFLEEASAIARGIIPTDTDPIFINIHHIDFDNSKITELAEKGELAKKTQDEVNEIIKDMKRGLKSIY